MQQLLTGEIRLPGFSGQWETKRLEEIADLHRQNVMPAAFGDRPVHALSAFPHLMKANFLSPNLVSQLAATSFACLRMLFSCQSLIHVFLGSGHRRPWETTRSLLLSFSYLLQRVRSHIVFCMPCACHPGSMSRSKSLATGTTWQPPADQSSGCNEDCFSLVTNEQGRTTRHNCPFCPTWIRKSTRIGTPSGQDTRHQARNDAGSADWPRAPGRT